ncbi:MAG: chromosomal replication initiator protein DnaA [Lachnospiraceae bacterium]|nr:chromosomal replication initiator protein DnaA [Lachnospiraceae bacterium]
MKELITSKWDEILEFLKTQYDISKISFDFWLKDLKFRDVADGKAVLYFEDPNMSSNISFIQTKYSNYIKAAIAEVIDMRISDIEITVDKPEEPAEKTVEKKTVNNVNKGISLNPDYTFDNFVVSSNSSMVYAAALKVSEAPGEIYNPLYIYGNPGLGKTHLMHSIAHYITENTPNLRVMYVTSEIFTIELIDSIRHGTITPADFRNKYRNIDVLLIDDIQFIIGKDSTQEEFFHTFNYLYEAKKQIVISSDKPPKDFSKLEDRLRSRFECGLLVDITSPDYETKMAILKKKLEIKQSENINPIIVDDEVLSYIAKSVTNNIRQLEGALTKIIAMSKLNHEPITLELAERALRDIVFPDQNKSITPEFVIAVVAEHFNINTDEIMSRKRNSRVVIPRHIAMYIIRKYNNISQTEIGNIFNRDHASVINALNNVEAELSTNRDFKANYENILKKLNLET